jgi:hypothetical protein
MTTEILFLPGTYRLLSVYATSKIYRLAQGPDGTLFSVETINSQELLIEIPSVTLENFVRID